MHSEKVDTPMACANFLSEAVARYWRNILGDALLDDCARAQVQILEIPPGTDLPASAMQTLSHSVQPVLVISRRPDAVQALSAVQAGAAGYLHALAHPERIMAALTALRRGQVWLNMETLRALTRSAGKGVADHLPETLTERERAIVTELATGATNREIANRLHISENTVKTHLKHIYDKFGVRDRTSLILKLRER
ncbi:response regulator transcription factor [Sulfurivirga sp.]|uniref:response regulator transcription factor n=1 Tax=Sulfurivirga sp. TaxID=2614236 RepID=UPI0025E60CDE|nr:response regulator transcription factor [Sulfurivirga sp.]